MRTLSHYPIYPPLRSTALAAAFPRMVRENKVSSSAAMRQSPILHRLPALRLVFFSGSTQCRNVVRIVSSASPMASSNTRLPSSVARSRSSRRQCTKRGGVRGQSIPTICRGWRQHNPRSERATSFRPNVADVPRDFAADCGTTAAATTGASLRRAIVMRSQAIDGRSAPAKIARLANNRSVAVRSSRPSCSKAEKREYSWQIGSSRESRLNGKAVRRNKGGDVVCVRFMRPLSARFVVFLGFCFASLLLVLAFAPSAYAQTAAGPSQPLITQSINEATTWSCCRAIHARRQTLPTIRIVADSCRCST